jgi:hypothetical protein
LDQAYRTSEDVFLIFGVNKSGEFYGYARFVLWFVSRSGQSELAYRMAGPIIQSEDRVPWSSRPTSPVPVRQLTASDVEGNTPISPPAEIVEGRPDPHYVFPPEEDRVVEQPPKDIARPQEGTPFVRFQVSADATYSSTDIIRDTPDQIIRQAAHPTIPASSEEEGSEDILEHARDAALQIVNEEMASKDPKQGLAEVWG